MKLEDSDIIALYSKGLWEHVDELEIDEIFSEASDDPQESVDILEDVLLSRQPKDLKSYTITAIFINKAYRDPERDRKRQRYIKIAIIVLIIILVIAIIAYIYNSWRQSKVDKLEETMAQVTQYMDAANFMRVQAVCQDALKMATDLNEDEREKDLRDDLVLIDQVLQAEELLLKNDYLSAYSAFKTAMRYSAVLNKNVQNYVYQEMSYIQSYMGLESLMSLGDVAFNDNNFDEAESLYSRARERASSLHNLEMQQKAVQAIEKIYDKKAQLQKDAEQKMNAKKQVAINDALKKGDELLAAGDFDGAQKAYLDARNLSDNPADRQVTSNALGQLKNAKEKKELEEKSLAENLKNDRDEASKIEQQGDKAFNDKDYLTAQM